jgi:hypothetical protein
LPVLCVLPLVEQHLLMHPDVQKLAGESCRLLGADGQLTFEPGWRARLRLTGDGLRLDQCTIEGPAGQGLQISGWINAEGRMELRGVLYDADVLPRTAATAQRDALRDALDGRSFTIVGMISELPDKLPPILEDLRGEVLAAAAQNASDADDPGQ